MKVLKEEVRNAIPETQYVLIEDTNTSSNYDRRRLATREWFDTDEDYIQYLLIIEALEIQVESETYDGDIIQNEVDWDLVEFDEEFLKLQLYFESPENMSQDLKQDVVSVTFYGTEFFQS